MHMQVCKHSLATIILSSNDLVAALLLACTQMQCWGIINSVHLFCLSGACTCMQCVAWCLSGLHFVGTHQKLHASFGFEGIWRSGLPSKGGWAQVQVHPPDRHQLGWHWLHTVSTQLQHTFMPLHQSWCHMSADTGLNKSEEARYFSTCCKAIGWRNVTPYASWNQ